jgi:hypothetical protein
MNEQVWFLNYCNWWTSEHPAGSDLRGLSTFSANTTWYLNTNRVTSSSSTHIDYRVEATIDRVGLASLHHPACLFIKKRLQYYILDASISQVLSKNFSFTPLLFTNMRDDILAKRMFLAGCFGLPWLWAVHSLYWYRKQQPNHAHDDDHQDALLATPSSSDTDGMSFRFFIKCVCVGRAPRWKAR